MRKKLLISILLLFGLLSCQKDSSPNQETTLRVRLQAEPDRLNPALSTSTQATQVERFLFQSLFDFDPYTLEYIPVLAEARPEIRQETEGGIDKVIYTYTIREDAKWDDGSPVTVDDYIFTLKAIFNPNVEAVRIRGYLSFIKEVIPSDNNPKQFSVVTEGKYFLNEEIVSNFYIMPEHIYDPEGLMQDVTLSELLDPVLSEELADSNEKLQQFAVGFNSAEYSRDKAIGSGPYKLLEWVNGQEIILERKDDWWGDAHQGSNVYFDAHPDLIIYKVIPDETVALAGLKDGSIDVMAKISPDNYKNLQEDTSQSEKYHFSTPTLMQYVHIVLNTKNPKLQDKRVRQALAYLVDMDYIVDDLFEGFATPTVGPVNPSKTYYRSDLPVRSLNLAEAEDRLEAAGWDDSEGDGVLDKVINSKKTDLELTLEVSGGLGEQLALVMQEKFREAGVNLKIERKEFRLIREKMQKGDFDMAAMLTRQAPSLVDLYQFLHSDNAGMDGGNFSKFGTSESDSLISTIRVTLDPDTRDIMYARIQEIIYDEQPSLFLVSPRERIVVNKSWDYREARLRPGIFEQALRKSD